MTARRSKPTFASLLRTASRREEAAVQPALPGADGAFHVDPARVRLWSGLAEPALESCQDRIAAIVRDGQSGPVTVRPVFDDRLYEYEVIAGARDFVAVRHLREAAIPALELLVRVELVDDEALADQDAVPAIVAAAFGGAVPDDAVLTELAVLLEGPAGPAILATAAPIARAQDARRGDGLPPYPAAEVMRLLTGEPEAAPVDPLALGIAAADANGVTFRLEGGAPLSPERLAHVVKAMIDGATAAGIPISWARGPSDATRS